MAIAPKSVLLISNSRDFATDFIVARLLERGIPYLRLDLDLLDRDRVVLDPIQPTLTIERYGEVFTLRANDLTSILFRAPTHLRESSGARHHPEELLARHQWAAFARSLLVFEDAFWINNPVMTYRAENKPYQLMVAARLGFVVPRTVVTNSQPAHFDPTWQTTNYAAIKALDSFLLRMGNDEDAFFYTQRVAHEDLSDAALNSMPVIVQGYLEPKIDLRVTVVEQQCFTASVLIDGEGISGDWRLSKDRAKFEPFCLPDVIKQRCVALVRQLGLVFGAIDLARVGDDYYFFEVNPTGEWAWLVSQCDMPIDRAIVDVFLEKQLR